jgi:hypothetical protein
MYHWPGLAAQFVMPIAISVYLLAALRDDAVRRRLGLWAAVLVCAGLMLRAGVGYLEARELQGVPWRANNPNFMYMRPHWQQRCDRFAAACETLAWCLLLWGIYRPWPPPRDSDISAPASNQSTPSQFRGKLI